MAIHSNTRAPSGRGRAWLAPVALAGAVIVVLGLAAPVSATGGSRPSRVAAQGTSSGTSYAQLSRGPASRGRTVHYAVPRHLCGKPSAGRVGCDAIKLVPASRGAHGAKAYVSPTYSTGPAGGYTPGDLAAAYSYDPTTMVHQTVAIVDANDDPHALADLNHFDAHYGLPAETSTSFRKVNQNGKASPLPTADQGWAGEIALDIETTRAVCNTCRILLVEVSSATDGNLAAGVDTAAAMGATEISNSYGGPESSKASPAVAAAYTHPGVVITASTGDNGWYDWDFANNGSFGASDNAPNVPAAYPHVVAVGGTALALNSDGTRNQEDVWNENGADDQNGLSNGFFLGAQGASGGGCSSLYTAPTWQAGVTGYANTGCGTNRLAGDVSAVADPYTGFDTYDSYGSGGWVTVGGTSLSSPLIAAMWALAGGAQGVAYPARTLYQNLEYRPSSVYDVTVGGNAFCAGDSTTSCSSTLEAETSPPTGNPNNLANGNNQYAGGWAGMLDCGYPGEGLTGTIAANTQCNAVTGYDGAGVGTPNGLELFTPTTPTIAIQTPSALKLNTAQTWTAVGFSDPLGGTATQYTWTWGDGSASTTTTLPSTTHTFSAAGTHQVTLTVPSSSGQTATAKIPITVGVKPTAVIGGKTTVHRGVRTTWTSRRSSDRNTGGGIVRRTWRLDGHKVSSATSWSHTFTRTGKHKLTLLVVDNTGLRGSRTITITVTR